MIADGTIEIEPVGYMRGRTLNRSFVVIDEAQNCTYGQIKMLLTRLDTLEDVAVIRFTNEDVVRHPLVSSILEVV